MATLHLDNVNFVGSAADSKIAAHNAAAGTLTGSTLASNVTASSLTSAAGGTFGTAAFTAASAYDPAGAAAAITAQLLDSDLTALAGLSTTGLVARTGAGTAATRTITGTANQITVTNGDGVAGNPTLALPQDIAASSATFSGTLTVKGGSYDCINAEASSSNAVGIRLRNAYSGAHNYNLSASGGGPAASGSFVLWDDTASASRLVVSPTGDIRFNAYGAGTLVTDSSGNVTASSDASLKSVTGSFSRGLEAVLKLTPRTYHWNEKSGMNTEDENVGFIAQEVLESIPEAVGQYRTSEVEVDGKKTKKREKAELLTLSDRPLIAALVNAVKELKAENDALSARIAKLEGKK